MKILLLLLAAIGCGTPAVADQVTFEFRSVYSGDAMRAKGELFARATFSSTAPGFVSLQLEAFVTPASFVSEYYFNFDPVLDLGQLSVSHVSGMDPLADGMHIGPADTYKAGGGGSYDILLEFPARSNIVSPRLNETALSTFLFSSSLPITAARFNFIGAAHGGYGPFSTAAHIQGLGSGGVRSTWVSGDDVGAKSIVPLPEAAWAGFVSFAAVAGFGYLRHRSLRV